jgi:hypothetical protein
VVFSIVVSESDAEPSVHARTQQLRLIEFLVSHGKFIKVSRRHRGGLPTASSCTTDGSLEFGSVMVIVRLRTLESQGH